MSTKTNPFIVATNAAKPYGCKPYHYKSEDKARFQAIMEHAEIDASYSVESLYTYWPEFDVAPVEESNRTSERDAIGFYRMPMANSLTRANMQNVRSCTRIDTDSGTMYPAGYLNYLSNPAWCQIAFYIDGCKPDSSYAFHDCLPWDSIPGKQPYGTVNAMLGYDADGDACAWLGNGYGDDTGMLRLASYLYYRYGLKVYTESQYGRVTYDDPKLVYGVPSPRLIKPPYGGDLFQRSGDVRPNRVKALGGTTYVLECQGGYPVDANRCNSAARMPILTRAQASETCISYYDRNLSPTTSRPMLSFVKDLWTSAPGYTNFVDPVIAGATSTIPCHECGDDMDEDDAMYCQGHHFCEYCCNRLFVQDCHGEYIYADDAVYSECMEEYIYSSDAVEFIVSTGRHGVTTDHVLRNRMDRYDVVELTDSYQYYDYAHSDCVTEIEVLSFYRVDGEIKMNSDTVVLVSDYDQLDDYTVIDSELYDMDAMSVEDGTYVYCDDGDLFNEWAEKYLLTPRLPGIDVIGRDAEAYAMTCRKEA